MTSLLSLAAAGPQWAEYIPVLVMLVFAFLFAVLNLGLSWILGRKASSNPVKDAAYECDFPVWPQFDLLNCSEPPLGIVSVFHLSPA